MSVQTSAPFGVCARPECRWKGPIVQVRHPRTRELVKVCVECRRPPLATSTPAPKPSTPAPVGLARLPDMPCICGGVLTEDRWDWNPRQVRACHTCGRWKDRPEGARA